MLKGDLKKQAILETAENLFFEKGYNSTTIDDILTVLKCSKGSLYHHFDSKQQILGELGRQHAETAFKQYAEQEYGTAIDAFNGLLYHAMIIRAGQERLVSTVLPLVGTTDESILTSAALNAQEKLFLPELCKLLEKMYAEGTAFCDEEFLPTLAWDTYTALYRRLLFFARDLQTGSKQPGDIVPILNSGRFLWERLLDVPFGSVEIIRADEALSCIHQAVTHNKYLA